MLILFITVFAHFSFFRNETTTIEHSPVKSVAYIVDLNTASAEELEMLDGIGPKTANAIIQSREKYGPFKYWIQLSRVPGIGQSVINKIKDYSKV